MPYRGSLPALNDVVAGHVPMMFVDFGPATGALQSGKVRPLGVSSKTRVPGYPDIPPLNEAGVPGFEAVGWQMLVAPAKTPRPVIDRLQSRVRPTSWRSRTPRIRSSSSASCRSRTSRSRSCKPIVKSETARWGKVVRDAGIAGSQ